MLEFIQLLKQRYQAIAHENAQNCIEQLILAEACLRKTAFLSQEPPLQLAVLGPTQAGKSSLVNALLQTEAAGVSPLAGYTVHAQGFCHGVTLTDCRELGHYFGRFQQLAVEQLSKERYDCYGLTELHHKSSLLPPAVLWDTPDFDSIESETYREGVLRAVALADVLILVVSKEKYADQSVWQMMNFLHALQQPVLICLNKLNEGQDSVLLASLKDKWQAARNDDFPPVIPLFYDKQQHAPQWLEAHHKVLQQVIAKANRKKHERLSQAFLKKYWQHWLEPVRLEHQALAHWQQCCQQLLNDALVHYQRDFLHHPHHYETFQQALAELLLLLEVPVVANVLANTRKVLTYPIKKLFKRKAKTLAQNSQELLLLKQIAEHALIQLSDTLLEQSEHGSQARWWQSVNQVLRTERQQLLAHFSSASQHYHVDFQSEVEHTAQQLYQQLQQQPMILNGLRATRVSADAAMIALSLHTGGIGVHDLVLAPAMLTVTSMLTESAIGGYMHKLQQELKQRQLQRVKQLFSDTLLQQLTVLPEQLPKLKYFNISPATVFAAEQQLTDKRHGLRLL